MTFSKVLLTALTIVNGPASIGLVLNSFRLYQDARVLISNHINLEQLKKNYIDNSEMATQAKKKEASSESSSGKLKEHKKPPTDQNH